MKKNLIATIIFALLILSACGGNESRIAEIEPEEAAETEPTSEPPTDTPETDTPEPEPTPLPTPA